MFIKMLEQLVWGVALFSLPGGIVVKLLLGHLEQGRVQWLALSTGVGICIAVIVGQVAVLIPVPPVTFAVIYLTIWGVIGSIVWWRYSWRLPSPKYLLLGTDGRVFSTLFASAVFCLALVGLIHNKLNIDPYTTRPADMWHYAQVQVQFMENPQDMNIQPGITAPGTNRRLLWNGWLYIQAVWNTVARSPVVEASRLYMLFALGVASLLTWVALARTLFQERVLAWVTGILHMGVVTIEQGQLWVRLPEDKFVSYFLLLPLIHILFLRLLHQEDRRIWVVYAVVTLGVTFVHPINAILIALTTLPTAILWHGIQRQWREIVFFIGWSAVLMVHPLVLQQQLTSDVFINVGMHTVRDVPWTFYWSPGLFNGNITPTYIYAVPICVLLVISLVWERGKRLPTVFLLMLVLTLALALYVPPFSALVTKVVTEVQSWRLFMLFPVGFIWGWLLWQVSLLALRQWAQVSGVVAMGILLVILWNWDARWRYDWHHQDTPIAGGVVEGMLETSTVVGRERVLTTEDVSLIFPTLVPDAQLAFWRSGVLQPEVHKDLTAAMNMTTDPSVAIDRHNVRYMLLPHDVPLVEAVNFDLPCCIKHYENEALNLYEWVYPLHRAERQHEINIGFGDFVMAKGYGLYEDENELFVTLFWEPAQQTEQPLTTFVHLLQSDRLVAQDDHPPRLGQISTQDWEVGQQFSDMYRLDLENVPVGEYEIQVGFYESRTLAPVAAATLTRVEITAESIKLLDQ